VDEEPDATVLESNMDSVAKDLGDGKLGYDFFGRIGCKVHAGAILVIE